MVNHVSFDFDGDGKSDILWHSSANIYQQWQTNGTSVTATQWLSTIPSYWLIAGAGDFDGDGTAEVLWLGTSGAIEVDKLGASGFTYLGTPGILDATWTVAAIGDFNGDGKSDILWQNTDHIFSEWLMNGGTASNPYAATIPSYWKMEGAGDFNGDGKAEVLWHGTSGALEIDRLDSTGFTSLGTLTATLDSSWSVAAIGDFNNDGNADILWHGAGSAYSEWLMNGTTVISTKALIKDAGWRLESAGDFNGDGKPDDLLWHNTSTNAIEVDSVSASGFTVLGQIGSLDSTWSAENGSVAHHAAMDFDGDGKSDILLHDTLSNYQQWQTDGSAVTSTQWLGRVPSYWWIAGFGDFNGDGKTEVLWQGATTAEVDNVTASGFVGLGGPFAPPSSNVGQMTVVAIGDFNADGKSDVLWQNGQVYSEWLMNGDSASNPWTGTIPASWKVEGSGDFNGDGKAEVLLHNTSGAVEVDNLSSSGFVFLGTASVTLDSSWSVAAIGDFNNDGNSDILWHGAGDAYSEWLMNGATVVSTTALTMDASWKAQIAGDFNGDGKADDILWRNTDSHAIAINSLDASGFGTLNVIGTLDDTWSFGAGSPPQAFADFEGDEQSNILWTNGSGAYQDWVMHGASVYQNAQGSAASGWKVEGIGNFDGDRAGRAEVLLRATDGTIQVDHLNVVPSNSIQFASMGAVGNLDSSWSVVALGDFSGDGKADLLWESSANVYQEWVMDGGNAPSVQWLGTIPSYWKVEGSADFDGNGKVDILLHHTDGTVEIDSLTSGFSMIGIAGNIDSSWSVAALGDFNGDGKDDILWHTAANAFQEWLMDGANVLSTQDLGTLAANIRFEGAGDFLGDGTAEVVLHNLTTSRADIDSIGASGFTKIATVGGLIDSTWMMMGGH